MALTCSRCQGPRTFVSTDQPSCEECGRHQDRPCSHWHNRDCSRYINHGPVAEMPPPAQEHFAQEYPTVEELLDADVTGSGVIMSNEFFEPKAPTPPPTSKPSGPEPYPAIHQWDAFGIVPSPRVPKDRIFVMPTAAPYDVQFQHDVRKIAALIPASEEVLTEFANMEAAMNNPDPGPGPIDPDDDETRLIISFKVYADSATEADHEAYDTAKDFFRPRPFELGPGIGRPLAYFNNGDVVSWEVEYTAWEVGPFDDDDDG